MAIGNLIEQEDMAKGLPDDVLLQEAQQPSGQLPQFLLISEVQRRTDMRKRYQLQMQEMEPTVAEQIMQEGITGVAQPPPEMQQAMNGGPPPMQPPMNGGPPPMAGPPQQPPTQMAYQGGVVGMQDMGRVPTEGEPGEGRSTSDPMPTRSEIESLLEQKVLQRHLLTLSEKDRRKYFEDRGRQLERRQEFFDNQPLMNRSRSDLAIMMAAKRLRDLDLLTRETNRKRPTIETLDEEIKNLDVLSKALPIGTRTKKAEGGVVGMQNGGIFPGLAREKIRQMQSIPNVFIEDGNKFNPASLGDISSTEMSMAQPVNMGVPKVIDKKGGESNFVHNFLDMASRLRDTAKFESTIQDAGGHYGNELNALPGLLEHLAKPPVGGSGGSRGAGISGRLSTALPIGKNRLELGASGSAHWAPGSRSARLSGLDAILNMPDKNRSIRGYYQPGGGGFGVNFQQRFNQGGVIGMQDGSVVPGFGRRLESGYSINPNWENAFQATYGVTPDEYIERGGDSYVVERVKEIYDEALEPRPDRSAYSVGRQRSALQSIAGFPGVMDRVSIGRSAFDKTMPKLTGVDRAAFLSSLGLENRRSVNGTNGTNRNNVIPDAVVTGTTDGSNGLRNARFGGSSQGFIAGPLVNVNNVPPTDIATDGGPSIDTTTDGGIPTNINDLIKEIYALRNTKFTHPYKGLEEFITRSEGRSAEARKQAKYDAGTQAIIQLAAGIGRGDLAGGISEAGKAQAEILKEGRGISREEERLSESYRMKMLEADSVQEKEQYSRELETLTVAGTLLKAQGVQENEYMRFFQDILKQGLSLSKMTSEITERYPDATYGQIYTLALKDLGAPPSIWVNLEKIHGLPGSSGGRASSGGGDLVKGPDAIYRLSN